MRIKNGPQLPGAGRTRAGHHHGSHTPTYPGTILLGKMPITPNKSAGSVCTVFCMNYLLIRLLYLWSGFKQPRLEQFKNVLASDLTLLFDQMTFSKISMMFKTIAQGKC